MSEILWKAPSGSNPNKTYDIIKGGDGVIYCTCIAWKMHKTCKHLQAYFNINSNPTPMVGIKIKKTAAVPEHISTLIAKEVAFLKGMR